MNFVRNVLILVALVAFNYAIATDSDDAPPEVKRRIEEVKEWNTFNGVWEGSFPIIVAPAYLQGNGEPIEFRITVESENVLVEAREIGTKWHVIDGTAQSFQISPVTLAIELHRSGGVWIESYQFLFARSKENEAMVYVQRVVNNWAAPSNNGETVIFSMQRAGTMKRSTNESYANKSLKNGTAQCAAP